MSRRHLLLFCLPWLAACAQLQMPADNAELLLPPLPESKSAASGGGVFNPAGGWSLVSDKRAYRTGDVLTVVLEETTQASKRAGTSFDKQSGVAITPSIIGTREFDTKASISAERDFKGNATSSQQNSLSGALTVVVHQVMPNGLLLVRGEKQLALNQGEEFLRLAGYVRSDDIDSLNRISSLRIANARIVYSGRGALNDANAPGWLTRFFNSPWAPF